MKSWNTFTKEHTKSSRDYELKINQKRINRFKGCFLLTRQHYINYNSLIKLLLLCHNQCPWIQCS